MSVGNKINQSAINEFTKPQSKLNERQKNIKSAG